MSTEEIELVHFLAPIICGSLIAIALIIAAARA